MRTNKATRANILIIEDEYHHFNNIKKWLEKCGYVVIPDKFDEMNKALRIGPGIDVFVQKLLQHYYRNIGLILCDIGFGNDWEGGSQIVKHIREFKNLTPSYWTSIVPIISMTNYADLNLIEDRIISAGADYIFRKKIIFDDLNEIHDNKDKNEAKTYRTIIDFQVEKFQKNLKLLYPSGLEDEIIRFMKRPKNKKTAFIMTSFQGLHMGIADRILRILKNYDIRGYIANSPRGMGSDYIWDNIQVFMHACDFGIGIYVDDLYLENDNENKTQGYEESFIEPNLNLSLEVGYMLGLQKEICILKHAETRRIPSDIAAMNYISFTTDNLEVVFTDWLERSIIDRY